MIEALFMKSFLFMINPAAGGLNQKVIKGVVDGIGDRGYPVQVYTTKAVGDATDFIRNDLWDASVVVAIGGDGTVNEVINGLVGKSAVLAVIPQGTTNVLGVEYNLPDSVDKIIAMLIQSKVSDVYPVRLNDKRFLLMAGVGYDADVVAHVDLKLKKRFGKLAYIWSMWEQLNHYGSYQFEYCIDDGPWEKAASMIISNGKYYGGQFVLSRSVRVSDPYFQVFSFKEPGKLSLLRYLMMLPLGCMESTKGLQVRHTKKIQVRSANHGMVQADGDVLTELPAIFETEEFPLQLITP
mgnify:CR=1 FL=1